MSRARTVAVAVVVAVAATGAASCGGAEEGEGPTAAPAPPAATEPADGTGSASDPPAEAPSPEPEVPEATCPPDAGNCRAVTGRVVFVESVDPDGDGDLHVVLAGGSVTLPGLTVLDVPPALRPAEDPRIGDLVTGAGPVHPGSRGQSQIAVTEFRVVRPR